MCDKARVLLMRYVEAVREHATETMELVRLINLKDRDQSLFHEATTKVKAGHDAFDLARLVYQSHREQHGC